MSNGSLQATTSTTCSSCSVFDECVRQPSLSFRAFVVSVLVPCSSCPRSSLSGNKQSVDTDATTTRPQKSLLLVFCFNFDCKRAVFFVIGHKNGLLSVICSHDFQKTSTLYFLLSISMANFRLTARQIRYTFIFDGKSWKVILVVRVSQLIVVLNFVELSRLGRFTLLYYKL